MYVADPALANAEALRGQLSERGVAVTGPTGYGSGDGATTVASLTSAPVVELVGTMLRVSDNQIADMLLKEIGVAASGTGSLASGRGCDAGRAGAPLRAARRSGR